ncbi:MAG: hypothetical protein RLZZ598_1283 [Pseudomonadota bacterium]
MNQQRPILFLGFDGVLHPLGCDRDGYLERLPMLASWLIAHPTVDVVISSGWMKLGPDRLAARLSAALYPRVVGIAMPNLGTSARGKAAGASQVPGAAGAAKEAPLIDGNVLGWAREFDVFIWHQDWRWSSQPWRVLETGAGQACMQCVQMIAVEPSTGLTEQTLSALDAWLDKEGGSS